MLQKMGLATSSAPAAQKLRAAEPIKVELKSEKLGLGAKTEIKRRLEAMSVPAVKESDFLQAVRDKKDASQRLSDLFKSQSCCFQLDTAASVEDPLERWYWPRTARKPLTEPGEQLDDDDAEEPDEDPEEGLELEDTSSKLEQLTSHLRNEYKYCIWCGIKFDSADDLAGNCPGDTRNAHDD